MHTLNKFDLIYAGINDFSWSRLDKSTPFKNEQQSTNLTKLAKSGLVLDNAYTLPICSPSRAAILTGIYPFKMGLQRGFSQQIPEGIPTNIKLLPEYLRTMGYKTHMFGKWHLGFCNEKYTPLERGFDSFQGRYVALEKQDKLDRFKYDFLNKTSNVRKKVSKSFKSRLNKVKKQCKKQKKTFLNENKRHKNNYSYIKRKSEKQRTNNKKRFENYKEVIHQLKQKQRKMYRYFSRRQGNYRRTKRSEQGFGRRPEDMESDSYRQQVAAILRSYNNHDKPFFIFLSFFTKSYRLDNYLHSPPQDLIYGTFIV